MQIEIRTIGNSRGVVLPEPVLAQVGLSDEACTELTVENGAIVLRKPIVAVRKGWAEAAKALAAGGEDQLVIDEFESDGDEGLAW